MADRHISPSGGGAALRTRLDLNRVLLPAAALLILLVAVVAVLVAGGGERAALPEAGTETALSAAAERVPASTNRELSLLSAQRRDAFPMLSWDVEAFSVDKNGRMSYTGGARTLTGIDVSEHQEDIDWKKVKADGIDFAMIRMGYRGSTSGGLYTDEFFEKNIAAANRAGLPVGVYFYSQAITVEEAREEAAFLLDKLKGHTVTFPVVFDWEIVGGSSARTYAVTRQTLCEITRAFCDEVKAAGYDPMIYFTQYLGYRKYILRNLTDYGFWYAEYAEQPRFAFDFDMWQYSETGAVNGIDGDVDLNLYFVRD